MNNENSFLVSSIIREFLAEILEELLVRGDLAEDNLIQFPRQFLVVLTR